MSGYLLDTNVLSEVIKRRPDQRVMVRLRTTPATALFTSSICVMELRFGSERRGGEHSIWERIKRDALPRVRILPVDENEAVAAGSLQARLAARGISIGIEDTLIAATALTHGLIVSTRNVKHLGRIDGLTVESWWPDKAATG